MKFCKLVALWVFLSVFSIGYAQADRYDLLYASKTGNLEKVEMLIKEGYDVNVTDIYGRSPLIFAAMEGKKEVAELLINNGAKIDIRTGRDWTPLLYAAEFKQVEVAKVLLLNGADVNAVVQGWTALLLAVNAGSKEMAELLLSYGANIEAKNSDGWTALVLAAYDGKKELVQVLLEHGANVEAKNNEGWSALRLADYYKHQDISDLLIKFGAKPKKSKKYFGTKLMVAFQEGNEDEVIKLINQGEDFDEKDHNGETLLIKATKEGNDKIVNLLLEKGARVDVRDKDGWTAFVYAIEMKHFEIAEQLLKYGADINARNFYNNWSPLMSAVHSTGTERAEFLLAHGANPNFKDKLGDTGLILAIENGNKELVSLFIKYGADVNANLGVESYTSKTALAAAARKGDIETIDLLLENGAIIRFLSKDWWLVLLVKKLHVNGAVAEDIVELWLVFAMFLALIVYHLFQRRTLVGAAVRGDVERVSYLLVARRDWYVTHRGYVNYALLCARQNHKHEVEMMLQGFLDDVGFDFKEDSGSSYMRSDDIDDLDGIEDTSLDKKFEGKKMYNWEEELDFDVDESFDDEFKNK